MVCYILLPNLVCCLKSMHTLFENTKGVQVLSWSAYIFYDSMIGRRLLFFKSFPLKPGKCIFGFVF